MRKKARIQVAGKMPARLESSVQAGVLMYLAFRPDIFWFRNNTGAFKPATGGFVRFGTVGSTDIIALQAPYGRFVGIETKRSIGGVLTDDQRIWGENIVRHGGIWIVAKDVQDVIDGLGPPTVKITKAIAVARERTYPRGSQVNPEAARRGSSK